MRAIESMTPPKKKQKSLRIPREVTVLGRKVRRLGGSTEYLEPGADVTVRTGVQMRMYFDGNEWTVDLTFALSHNANRAQSYGCAPAWRKAVAQAEGRMLDLFRELGDRLDYEVE